MNGVHHGSSPRTIGFGDERAVALPVAIVVVIAILIAITAVMVSTMASSRSARESRARAVSDPLLDSAVTRIRFGLQNELLLEEQGFRFDRPSPPVDALGRPDVLVGLVRMSSSLPSASRPAVVKVPTTGQLTLAAGLTGGTPGWAIREPLEVASSSATVGYWQPIAVKAPNEDGASGAVTVYIRTWMGRRTTDRRPIERPEIFRVRLKPGRFLDYQLLVNGPINFQPGATIDGPVHSNGYRDATGGVATAPMPADTAVFASSPSQVTCTPSGSVTTTPSAPGRDSGIVDIPATCAQAPGSRNPVNLLSVEDSFDAIRRSCNRGTTTMYGSVNVTSSPHAMCFFTPQKGADLPPFVSSTAVDVDLRGYRVELAGNTATVSVYQIGALNEHPSNYPTPGFPMNIDIGTGDGKVRALYFTDHVVVSGTTTGRVTIAARRPVVREGMTTHLDSSPGAANIYVVGDTRYDRAGDPQATLGLIAQGSILLETLGMIDPGVSDVPWRRPCISNLHAAMVAETGALRIDPRYTTKAHHPGYTSCSNELEIQGSIASFAPPVLHWAWTSGPPVDHFGFKHRTYRYDEKLRLRPPPFYPLTEPWQAISREPANLDCLSSAGALEEAAC